MVEHPFMIRTVLYKDINSRVPLPIHSICRNVSYYDKNCEVLKKLNIFGSELAISQSADDTFLLFKDEHHIPVTIQNIEVFSKASRLFLNIQKCELHSIYKNAQNVICDILFKTVVKHLGVHVTTDQKKTA